MMGFFDFMMWNLEAGEPAQPDKFIILPPPVGFPGVENIIAHSSPMVGVFVLLALVAVTFRKRRRAK